MKVKTTLLANRITHLAPLWLLTQRVAPPCWPDSCPAPAAEWSRISRPKVAYASYAANSTCWPTVFIFFCLFIVSCCCYCLLHRRVNASINWLTLSQKTLEKLMLSTHTSHSWSFSMLLYLFLDIFLVFVASLNRSQVAVSNASYSTCNNNKLFNGTKNRISLCLKTATRHSQTLRNTHRHSH